MLIVCRGDKFVRTVNILANSDTKWVVDSAKFDLANDFGLDAVRFFQKPAYLLMRDNNVCDSDPAVVSTDYRCSFSISVNNLKKD
jgi:hypothetical protein